jgi:DNA-binding HxlR family transcriptional regulator
MNDLEIRCPVSRTLKVIGGKWKSLIIYHLNEGDQRNGQLRRAIPEITQKMLTQQLRELEQDGLVEREVFPVVPPRVDYRLTDLGMSVLPVLEAMASWGEANADSFPAVLEVAVGGK